MRGRNRHPQAHVSLVEVALLNTEEVPFKTGRIRDAAKLLTALQKFLGFRESSPSPGSAGGQEPGRGVGRFSVEIVVQVRCGGGKVKALEGGFGSRPCGARLI